MWVRGEMALYGLNVRENFKRTEGIFLKIVSKCPGRWWLYLNWLPHLTSNRNLCQTTTPCVSCAVLHAMDRGYLVPEYLIWLDCLCYLLATGSQSRGELTKIESQFLTSFLRYSRFILAQLFSFFSSNFLSVFSFTDFVIFSFFMPTCSGTSGEMGLLVGHVSWNQ